LAEKPPGLRQLLKTLLGTFDEGRAITWQNQLGLAIDDIDWLLNSGRQKFSRN
jgi:hypothetical protein